MFSRFARLLREMRGLDFRRCEASRRIVMRRLQRQSDMKAGTVWASEPTSTTRAPRTPRKGRIYQCSAPPYSSHYSGAAGPPARMFRLRPPPLRGASVRILAIRACSRYRLMPSSVGRVRVRGADLMRLTFTSPVLARISFRSPSPAKRPAAQRPRPDCTTVDLCAFLKAVTDQL